MNNDWFDRFLNAVIVVLLVSVTPMILAGAVVSVTVLWSALTGEPLPEWMSGG